MSFVLALSIAVSFWGARSAPLTCQPKVIVGTSADLILPKDEWGIPAAMGAIPETYTIYVSSFAAATRTDRDLRVAYCQEVVHEVGHIVGRPHSDDPTSIMYFGAAQDFYAPWDCWHWRTWAKRHSIPIRR